MSKAGRPIDFLITGVSSGLGKALAQELLDLNFSVIGICRQSPQGLTLNPNFQFMKLDLSDAAAVQSFVTQFPKSQIPKQLILNAAITQNDMAGGILNRILFDRTMQINLHSNISLLLHFSIQMQDRENSTIAVINHLNHIRAFRNDGFAVNASKSALEAIMRNYRLNPTFQKINFLSVFPSRMEYDSSWPMVESYQQSAKKILAGIFQRKETLYLPKWLFLFYELSRLLPDKYLRKILHMNFSSQPGLSLENSQS